MYSEGPTKTFTASGALAIYRRVRLDSNGELAYASATDTDCIGITTRPAFARGDRIAVWLLTSQGTFPVIAATSFAARATLYAAASGKVDDTGTILHGIALEAAGAGDDQVEALVSKAASTAFSVLGSLGSSGSHATDATSGGSALALYVDPTAAIAARFTTLRAESLLNSQIFTTQGAGLYTIRGLAGVKAASTYKGSANQAFLAGVQGKLTMAADSVLGDNASGGIYACAVLAQLQLAAGAIFGTDAQVYGLWVDNQVGAALPTLSHLLNLTNNGGAITNLIHGYGNNAVSLFMTLETMGAAVVAATGVSTISKALKIKIDGTTYYIPCCTGTS